MIRTENDSLEVTQIIQETRKDFRTMVPHYLSHNFNYHADGSHLPKSEGQSFIVDWQLSMEEDFNKPWY